MGKFVQSKTPFHFIFNGVEYDATDYVEKHPGGVSIIQNMKAERKDFTQYFKCLHSEEAEKLLKSFPIVSVRPASLNSQEYLRMYEKVKHLYEPKWGIQAILVISISLIFLNACFTDAWWLSILCFALSQLIGAWISHSMSHSRCKTLYNFGKIFSPFIDGLSYYWWNPKHNMHHTFTNSLLYDEDINHSYKRYLFPFLYLKWRYDSLEVAFRGGHFIDVLMLLSSYALILKKNSVYFLVGELIIGFFAAFIFLGNHEDLKKYPDSVKESFLNHQLFSCKNYNQNGWFWLIIMGGVNYHTQHHLFPQIPFYNLPAAEPIIREELSKMEKEINYGPVI